jgi:Uroporphyrinogen decarboxylase (URO-D)
LLTATKNGARFGPGHYTEMVAHPLANSARLSTYCPPDPDRPELYTEAERLIRDFRTEYWIVGVTVTTIFETAWALRGYERLMMDFVEDPELAETILDIPYLYHMEAAKRLTRMGVDMIWTGDDVGAQNRMLISPRHWRRHLRPTGRTASPSSGWLLIWDVKTCWRRTSRASLNCWAEKKLRGCLKSPDNAKFTERGTSFMPALRKLK